jgi:PTS system mannose-specific IIA component
MIGVVVVTHGQLATELVNAAETIVGDLPAFAAVSIGWHEDAADARHEIEQAVARVGKDAGVLILTDMIKLASLSAQSDLLAAAREIREQGRNAIWVASDLLRGEKTS